MLIFGACGARKIFEHRLLFFARLRRDFNIKYSSIFAIERVHECALEHGSCAERALEHANERALASVCD